MDMSAWSLLELSPAPSPAETAPHGQDVEGLRQHLADVDIAIIELSRQITEAIVSKQATRGLSIELHDIIEARDFMRARLARLMDGKHAETGTFG
jgi:hypothetical protein